MENISMLRSCYISMVHTLNVRDIVGHTPLHRSCRSGALDIVQCFLERGADVNAQCCRLYTPVSRVGRLWMPSSIEVTYRSQGQYRISGLSTESAIYTWQQVPNVRRDHIEIMQLLLDEGANPKCTR